MMKRTITLALKLVLIGATTVFAQTPSDGDSNGQAYSQEVPIYFNHDLTQLQLEDVPEEVLVGYGRRVHPETQLGEKGERFDLETSDKIRAFILESLPRSWSVSASSRLSVSDAHSKAGEKSIRWDWKKGDVLRIRNLKGISDGRHDIIARLSICQEQPLPQGTTIRVFCKDNRRDRRGTKVATYWMTYRHWHSLFVKKAEPFAVDGLDASGLTPETDELLIQAPTTIESGTFYLDRLLISDSDPGRNILEIGGEDIPDIVNHGIPNEPYDPTAYVPDDNGGRTIYFGKFAKKNPVPKSLTEKQQAYITSLRGEQAEVDLSIDAPEQVRLEVQKFLDEVLVRNDDGTYRYPHRMNILQQGSPDAVLLFPGDHMAASNRSMKYKWIPKVGLMRGQLSNDINQWLKYPGCKQLEYKVKATLDWFRYHGLEDGKNGGEYLHRSYVARDLPVLLRIVPVFKALGTPQDLEYADYLSGLAKWGNSYNRFLYSDIPGATREVGVAASQAYLASFTELDDKVLYRDLDALRRRWNRTIAISDYGAMSMIKPDYTFFHHGHLIGYWGGNYGGYLKEGLRFLGTPLEQPEDRITYKNLAEHSIRFLYCFPTIHDINPWLSNSFGKLEPISPRETDFINQIGATGGFDQFYAMDWEQVPAARKYLASVLRDYHLEPYNLQQIHDKYPKTKGIPIEAAQQFHLDLNWSAASVYVTGMTKVHARSFNYMASSVPEPEGRIFNLPHRAFGSLFIHESKLGNRHAAHLGGNAAGYDWSRTSGVTMPKLSMEEIRALGVRGFGGDNDVKTDENGHSLHYGGSVTFGETASQLGQWGNLAIHINPRLRLEGLKKHAGDFHGNKSYHFLGNQIICLGTGFKTFDSPVSRHMETTLFQNAVGDENWQCRDLRRWSLASPEVVVNSRTFKNKGVNQVVDSSQNCFVISPYGHAWIIPQGQNCKLHVQWADQENAVSSKLSDEGEKATGEFVTAWLDHGDAAQESDHRYCILLNSDGQEPAEFLETVKRNAKEPRYKVLRQDDIAHVVYSKDDDLYSYIFFTPRISTQLPHIESTDRRLNIMVKPSGPDTIQLAISDPTILVSRGDGPKQSPPRVIKVVLAHKRCKLVKATSGLPQTNPDLNATITGDDQNVLTYTTRNGVTDNFVIELTQ